MTTTETPVYSAIVLEYEELNKLPKAFCPHSRIYQDEPRDGGGAHYRCKNRRCSRVITSPEDWEAIHDKEWDWWM